MSVLRVQHIWNPLSGLAEDQVVNTFHFRKIPHAATEAGDAQLMIDNVQRFFQANAGGVTAELFVFLASTTFAAVHTSYKVYDLDDPAPRAPILATTPANIASNTSVAALPHEVALCLSYKGDPVSGVVAARRRGRLYLGPINMQTGTMTPDPVTHLNRPAMHGTSMAQNAITFAKRLQVESNADGYEWVVYSPTLHSTGGSSSLSATRITSVFVDDAFDTQRRRGPSPKTRLTDVVV